MSILPMRGISIADLVSLDLITIFKLDREQLDRDELWDGITNVAQHERFQTKRQAEYAVSRSVPR
jgi:hypothetical protein